MGGLSWTETGSYGSVLPAGARSALISLRTSAGTSSKSSYLLGDIRLDALEIIFVDPLEAP